MASAPVQTGLDSKIDASKQIRLNSDNAEKIFVFLVKSFREDCLQRKMPQERSGWRSFRKLCVEEKFLDIVSMVFRAVKAKPWLSFSMLVWLKFEFLKGSEEGAVE